jgi:hypothetical protein
MVHAAHASRYHWGIVGKPVNFARGEWQISRVYSILKRSEPASYHAKRCLQICKENKIGDFDLAYAYEALARVSKINHSRSDQAKYYDKSLKASDNIRDSQDRALLLKDLRNLKPHR